MNVKTEIRKSFNQHAQEYEKAAKVQAEIGNRLFERLDYLKINPRFILDLGCGPGLFSQMLAKKYPKSTVIAVDFSQAMLLQARKKQSWRKKWPLINADMEQLPFADGLFDLVFANQVIHWSPGYSLIFRELNRVMNQEGCLMFSTLGPDTFQELKLAWSHVDNYAHTNSFADMHDIGDGLLAEHFLDPVVDMEKLTVQYASIADLLNSLKAQGVRNINPARNTGLTSRQKWQQFLRFLQRFRTEENKYPLTYEIVYGHAWKGSQHSRGNILETVIPISQIRRK